MLVDLVMPYPTEASTPDGWEAFTATCSFGKQRVFLGFSMTSPQQPGLSIPLNIRSLQETRIFPCSRDSYTISELQQRLPWAYPTPVTQLDICSETKRVMIQIEGVTCAVTGTCIRH